ncbi:hypothetical protein NDJ06_06030 [Vibrio alginolyticus]|uniref:hypothetical protein n=1 Tax=Vibrio alginolyticus TaxID=663 RepID=UPI00215F962F|nr:hypothetical protein [Vibrio alginolyticus]MCS0184875.1 hypothetical protein [Vibrio alginolyticus]HCG7674828.1 hypothetical protein [Vibrio parahaemolyticus]
MEAIQVLDTAIKIGLGACISGVTAYVVTIKNNNHQKKSSLIEKKITILQNASESIDTYLIKLNDVFSWMDGILRQGYEPGLISKSDLERLNIREKDRALIDSRKLRSRAISQLNLIGAHEAAKHCETLQELENKYRMQVIFKPMIPTEDELKEFREEFKTIKNSIYVELQSYFEKLYS